MCFIVQGSDNGINVLVVLYTGVRQRYKCIVCLCPGPGQLHERNGLFSWTQKAVYRNGLFVLGLANDSKTTV